MAWPPKDQVAPLHTAPSQRASLLRTLGTLTGSRVGLGIGSVVATLGLLQLAGLTGLLSRNSFPLVTEVLVRVGEELLNASMWLSVWHTLSQAMAGLALGTAGAIAAGLLLGRVALLEKSLRPVIEFLRPIPSVAILPLVILTVGVGFTGALVLTSISAFWLVLVMTIRGARAVDPTAQQTLVIFGVPKWARIWHLLLPSALPFILTGVRIAASVTLVVAITAELLGGMPGLGKDIQSSLQNADKVGVYAYTAVAGLLGLAVNLTLVPVENRLLSWHASRRKAVS